jgi:hypothetical protein
VSELTFFFGGLFLGGFFWGVFFGRKILIAEIATLEWIVYK